MNPKVIIVAIEDRIIRFDGKFHIDKEGNIESQNDINIGFSDKILEFTQTERPQNENNKIRLKGWFENYQLTANSKLTVSKNYPSQMKMRNITLY